MRRLLAILPLLLLLLASLALQACQGGGKLHLRPVSADERIEQYQLPRGARVPSVSGLVPGDSDIVGSNAKTQAANPPDLSPQPENTAQATQTTTTHIVRKGESLLAIARKYGVKYQDILTLNGISNPNLIVVGQRLTVPTSANFVAGETRHIIKKDETLYAIAKKYGVSVKSLKKTNRIRNANKLNVGQLLIVQGSSKKTTATTTKRKASKTKKTSQRRQTIANTPQRDRKDFLRPVSGSVLSRFGEKRFGQRNNGIDIAAKAGSSVKAAENGIVVYSGAALKGFGNLILVRHADGYLSAYGYNRKNLVSRGDRVKRGQPIAEVGSSGDVKKTMLHFELRRNSRPIDPLKHFAKS